MSLLHAEDERLIEAKIAEIEQRTASELVVAVVPRSAAHHQAWLGLAFAFGIPFGVLAYLVHIPPLWQYLSAFALAGLIYALRSTPLWRAFLSKAALDAAVQERARRFFSARGVDRTEHRTGVLLFISEFEHRVVILGDTAIHERLGDAGWQAHVDHVVSAIRRGQTTRGVLEVLDRLGAVLAELLPVAPGDRNELPNSVVREAE
ncbi:MAG TPA: TPM domain-containing protein [Polyangiaceae bacterium]